MNLLLRVSNYITRYAPSERKLREYISKKKPTFHTTDFLKEIGYDEGTMCDMWIRSFLASSKGRREMIQKLTKKGFPRDMILSKIEDATSEIEDWGIHEREVLSKIDTLLKKGKSKTIIQMTLVGKYPYFKDQITAILEDEDDTLGLEKEVAKYRQKYDLSNPKEKQNFYAALQRKGFSYGKIRDTLAGE